MLPVPRYHEAEPLQLLYRLRRHAIVIPENWSDPVSLLFAQLQVVIIPDDVLNHIMPACLLPYSVKGIGKNRKEGDP